MASRLLSALLGGALAPAEDALLVRLRRGEPEAFSQLVRRHQARVHGFCLRMLGDAEEAKDATQEVFLSLHRALPGFRGEAQLSTWMYRVAMNRCLNWKKSRARKESAAALPLSEVTSDLLADEAPGPHEQLESRHEQGRVHRALRVLPDEQRALVLLRDVEGLSYEEITTVTGLPEGTVKSRLHRARERMAVELREESKR